MRAALETVVRAANAHIKSMGVGSARLEVEFQSYLLKLRETLDILSGDRVDVRQIREAAAGALSGIA